MSETIARIRHRDRRVRPRQPLWPPYRHQRHWVSSLANFAPPFHASSSFASPLLVSIHEIGNESGVHKMEISQAGSSQPKNVARHLCYCARAWDQTPQRARQSKHQWGTRSTLIAAVSLLLRPNSDATGPMLKFLPVIGPDCRVCVLLTEEGWLRQ